MSAPLAEAASPLFEVFVRSKQGLDHKHVGSLHASDAQHALTLAGMLAVGGTLSFPFVTLAEKTEAMGEQRHGWEDLTIKKLLASLTTRDFSIVVVASALAGKLHWFLWGAALGAHMFWMVLAWLLFRAGRFAEVANLWRKKEI